ncbi:hypothetical protein CYLTODRAFT_490261 [Cylindrobasidium torrendii FP15055 ss-10]|uniref:Transmembrane protein n=1 Tax=Cylindrobasidium torrendii FP15055 ss-10 TaxID=1314674 RepID=A0A0D7BBG5_9AGAR|nr:hypothetical protein CYLTODRAFT_490261 [Cylindrobasidium torrendii FP15055 ss-10]
MPAPDGIKNRLSRASRYSSRTGSHVFLPTIMLAYFVEQVVAQAPVNDVISWPSGLLLLASVLYAALGNSPDFLWEIEPIAGLFLASGLPVVSIPLMLKVNWVSKTCHFVSHIRTAYGESEFWIRSEAVTVHARKTALEKVTGTISCVRLEKWDNEPPLDEENWRATSAGLLYPFKHLPPPSPSPGASKSSHITAEDFLYFAAIDYHAFRSWKVEIHSGGKCVFSTAGMPASTVIDVDSEDSAIYVVAANMVRRPHSQSPLRAAATLVGEDSYTLNIDAVDLNAPACAIDFHSYAPEKSKVSASLVQLAHSYYTVVQHIKATSDSEILVSSGLARIVVGRALWISILGGAVLDTGRLTIQNLPGRWGMRDLSADDAYLSRIETVLDLIKPTLDAYNGGFDELVYSNGLSRRTAIPFLIAGLFGQAIICYFLSVGTSAGVWTSVALANCLYAGRLTDWHSIWCGKNDRSEQPGMKMYLPGTKDIMCIATLDRSTPRQGHLRQGFLLNSIGLIAAILGAVFQGPTRDALGFSEFTPTPAWVLYAAVGLCVGASVLILSTVFIQQLHEKTWNNDSLMPTRWMVYTTIIPSMIISGLGLFFQQTGKARLWPLLDALTWVSGLPMGMIENGRVFPADDNLLHLVLLNRWIMGAVASSLGSTYA